MELNHYSKKVAINKVSIDYGTSHGMSKEEASVIFQGGLLHLCINP